MEFRTFLQKKINEIRKTNWRQNQNPIYKEPFPHNPLTNNPSATYIHFKLVKKRVFELMHPKNIINFAA
ncbi:MAG: hypothetical protein CVU11_03870 [Bacteroidetes bacterium HGW-Bacteroidetes-6]|jgi:hypothetical protein|nr:MAG: hypothetical protein CVU11_03870 [Bacteroidetes bacterium HGW-Bacteroidetes-6]